MQPSELEPPLGHAPRAELHSGAGGEVEHVPDRLPVDNMNRLIPTNTFHEHFCRFGHAILNGVKTIWIHMKDHTFESTGLRAAWRVRHYFDEAGVGHHQGAPWSPHNEEDPGPEGDQAGVHHNDAEERERGPGV